MKYQKIISLSLTTLLFLGFTSACSNNQQGGGGGKKMPEGISIMYDTEKLGYYIIGYNGSATTLEFPDTYDDGTYGEHPLMGIVRTAFNANSVATQITIPAQMSDIANEAFAQSPALVDIQVNENNKYYAARDGILYDEGIETLRCFPRGKSVTTWTMPSTLTKVGEYSAFGNANLTKIICSEMLESIGRSAFKNCTSLANVDFSACSLLTTWGIEAFYGCTSLTSSFKIPSCVTTINSFALGKCTGMTSIIIPSTVTYLSAGAFISAYISAGYAEPMSKPSGWDANWDNGITTVYWYAESSTTGCWHYVAGVPTLW